jgi:hypothetical protein
MLKIESARREKAPKYKIPHGVVIQPSERENRDITSNVVVFLLFLHPEGKTSVLWMKERTKLLVASCCPWYPSSTSMGN